MRRPVLGVVAAVAVVLGGTAATTSTAAAGERDRAAATSAAKPVVSPAEARAFLDKELPARLAKFDIPGAAAVVVSGGRQVAAKGYGVADTERRTPVDAERTRFMTGSVAKVVTAVAVMQQVERGKLDLDANVNRYLTRFKIPDSYPGHPVTVRNLLTHTSGFDTTVLGVGKVDAKDAGSLEDYLRTEQPDRVRPPGKVVSYDNYGVSLAGYLVQKVSGTDFADYAEKRILRPLGMSETTFDQRDPRVLGRGSARGHHLSGDQQVRSRGQFGAMTPTGAGTVSTAADMGRLMRALMDGGKLGKQRVLSPSSTADLQRRHFGPDPRQPGMAYVLTQDRREGQDLLLKDGDVPGFHSLLAMLPEHDTGIYITVNGEGTDISGAFAIRDLVNDFVARFFPAKGAGAKGAGAKGAGSEDAHLVDAARYEGSYRSTRTSAGDLSRASALFGDVTVSADGKDGAIITSGPLSLDPNKSTQQWVPIGRDLFRERGGQDTISFTGGRLQTSQDPTVAYTRSAWYASSTTHQITAGVALLVLLTALLGWPVAALVRKVRGRSGSAASAASAGEQARPAATTARVLGWIAAAMPVVFLGLFMTLAADPIALNEAVFLDSSPLLTGSLVALTLAAVATAASVVCTVDVWRRGRWGRAGRIHYTLVTVSAIAFLAVMAAYNLVGWPLLTG